MTTNRISLARVTIEAKTPLTVGTGGGNDVEDSICVVDANGLPTIPGSSIAGALRHLLAADVLAKGMTGSTGDPDTCEITRSLFGFQEENRGSGSRVTISWAQVHDENDTPVAFRREAPLSDFLITLAVGVKRDHVSIGLRGAGRDTGKFDETLVSAGARFTFEISIDNGDEQGAEMARLLALVADKGFSLGGRTRRGYGQFAIKRIRARQFVFNKEMDRKDWGRLPVGLEDGDPAAVLSDMPPPEAHAWTMATATIRLMPQDYWLIGGGEPDAAPNNDKTPDVSPVREARIVWTKKADGEFGGIGEATWLLPASSVKGALRHRTAFHLRRRLKSFAKVEESQKDTGSEGQAAIWPDGVKNLFGDVKRDDETDAGTPGRVFLSDLYLMPEQARSGWLDHVTIDRYTAAPVDGRLYSEAPLHRFQAALELTLLVDTLQLSPDGREGYEALKQAVDDLVHGRLGLGAAGNRGHGYFAGTVTWNGER